MFFQYHINTKLSMAPRGGFEPPTNRLHLVGKVDYIISFLSQVKGSGANERLLLGLTL